MLAEAGHVEHGLAVVACEVADLGSSHSYERKINIDKTIKEAPRSQPAWLFLNPLRCHLHRDERTRQDQTRRLHQVSQPGCALPCLCHSSAL